MIKVVTTCSKPGFKAYGRQMIETFSQFWSPEIRLLHYVEGYNYFPQTANVELRELPPWFYAWKKNHDADLDAHGLDERRNPPGKHQQYWFKRDCVKFAHKIAALTDAAADDCDLLIWADADIITHAPITKKWLESLFPDEDRYMAWLNREGTYPECGWMMFRPGNPCHHDFMKLLREEYEQDHVFRRPETHDSYVIQQIVEQSIARGEFKQPFNLAGKQGGLYVFHYSRLGECLDHAKGGRKKHGRTPKGEVIGRTENHWK